MHIVCADWLYYLRYNDTPDGDWIIGRDPADSSLLFATGGSGHAYKVLNHRYRGSRLLIVVSYIVPPSYWSPRGGCNSRDLGSQYL